MRIKIKQKFFCHSNVKHPNDHDHNHDHNNNNKHAIHWIHAL